jgi:hypothetical protein
MELHCLRPVQQKESRRHKLQGPPQPKQAMVANGMFEGNLIFINGLLWWTASVVWWSEFLSADPEVPGSIPGATRFSE